MKSDDRLGCVQRKVPENKAAGIDSAQMKILRRTDSFIHHRPEASKQRVCLGLLREQQEWVNPETKQGLHLVAPRSLWPISCLCRLFAACHSGLELEAAELTRNVKSRWHFARVMV